MGFPVFLCGGAAGSIAFTAQVCKITEAIGEVSRLRRSEGALGGADLPGFFVSRREKVTEN